MNLTDIHNKLQQKHITGAYKIIEFLYLIVAWAILFIKPSLYKDQMFLLVFLSIAVVFLIHHIYSYYKTGSLKLDIAE